MSSIRLSRLVRSTALIGALTFATTAFAWAQAPRPDYRRANPRDRQVTTNQQRLAIFDRQAPQRIRLALMRDRTLSVNARNVQLFARNGELRLRGSVRSDDERRQVEMRATEVYGRGHVVNEMTVAPRRPGRTR
jgi:osmotically-inducible protein OsmY